MISRGMIADFKIILISITAAALVSGTPRYLIKSPLIVKPQKLATCLPLGNPCMKSKDPCCTLVYKQTYLGLGTVSTTCFKFGKGICQVDQSIENFDEYSELVRRLNGTNFQELKKKYWSSIPVAYTCPQKLVIEVNSG